MTDNITINLKTSVGQMVAISKGWSPKIEDTTQEIVEDNYPLIPNPISYIQFLQELIPQFIEEYVLEEGRKLILNDLISISEAALSKVKTGLFDEMIMNGDFEGIKTLVKNNL